jgi:hypothetical protein
MRLSQAFIVALIMHAGSASAGGPCDCDDLKDLINRVKEVDAAIATYKFQIEGVLAKEKKDQAPYELTNDNYLKMQARIQQELDRVTDPNARKATGKTGTYSCKTELKAPTKCLESVVSKHETLHRQICESTSSLEKLTTLSVRLVDMAQEEINAYAVERDYLLGMIKALPCKPKGWFGTVTYQIVDTTNGTRTIPASKRGNTTTDGGSDVQTGVKTTTGAIQITDGVASSTEDVGLSFKREENVTGSDKCSMNKPIEQVSRRDTDASDGSDSTTGKPEFGVSITKNTGVVTFGSLHHKTKMHVATSQHSTMCGHGPDKDFTNDTTMEMGSSERYEIPGKLSPDGLTFDGQSSKPILPETSSSSGGSSFSHSTAFFATVTLHRVIE